MVITEQSSFRDPAGQVLIENGEYIRRISLNYLPEYQRLMSSGLYDRLIKDGLLLPHTEIDEQTLKPEQLWFVSYPYEWCFNQLKQATLVTLEIAKIALDYNMMLKDASAYNIQYYKGKWLLIDTLSFETYREGTFWEAYGQFLRHFYLPLALAAYRSPNLIKELGLYLDGIPLQYGASLLPIRSMFNPRVLLHLHAHRLRTLSNSNGARVSKISLIILIEHLKHNIECLKYKPKSDWTNYDETSPYTLSKVNIIKRLLSELTPNTLCDIGANTGRYSQIALGYKHKVIAIDREHDCIEQISQTSDNILPLVVDFTNPSPAIGWANMERKSFLDRTKFDTVMALALIHHVCLSNNVPLEKVADVLARMTKRVLIVEFIPSEDPKAQLLAKGRVFPRYDLETFTKAFSKHFNTVATYNTDDTQRVIYHMEKK